ncbi:hypothetical protein PVW47_01490 [Marinovum sp. SP66]|uniref:hypothetical protein n=1 Tax=Marinovum TaxID=367771 RepID=UPI00237A23F9|nr:hypothetical protein [Marinovum sp. SP66]MDD9738446.1 hypothetical protein [Marinovum sp. SP66]
MTAARMAPVVKALAAGLGVDDMAALGICPAEEARAVIAQLRACGGLAAIYGQVMPWRG